MFKSGVLLNAGDAIERLAEADHVIFDKTGTLILPELEVVNAADIPANIFALAGQLALSSHHTVAVAIAQASGAKSPLIAAAAMSGSSILVMLNALRARSARGEVGAAQVDSNSASDPALRSGRA